jgi:hypothetical protein
MIPLTEEGKSIKIFRSSHAPNTLRKTSKEAQLPTFFTRPTSDTPRLPLAQIDGSLPHAKASIN